MSSRDGACLECRRLTPEWERPLALFFDELRAAGDDRYFHPHPLTPEQASRVASYGGRDLYYALTDGDCVLAYGMLRGWDEGYVVPSIGLAVHPGTRGLGLGTVLMLFLHAAAKRRGATRIRLKVHQENQGALDLYRRLGYRFDTSENGQLVGLLDLK